MTDDLAAIVRAAPLAVAALMPIVNPLGSAPIFLSMSADLPTAARRHLSRQVAWNSFLLLAAAMLVGSHVLRLFGISVPIVRVGGGLPVVANGWRLLNAGGGPAAGHRDLGARSGAPRVLSADISADGRAGIDLDCDHTRRRRIEPFHDRRRRSRQRPRRRRAGCAQRLPELSLCVAPDLASR